MTGTIDRGAGRETPVPPLMDAVRGPGYEPANAIGGGRRLSQPDDKNDDADDAWGLFGPETVTWRVHSDPLIGIAALRSLALRVLHPEGLANVFATAQRVDDPWDRLTGTLRNLGVLT